MIILRPPPLSAAAAWRSNRLRGPAGSTTRPVRRRRGGFSARRARSLVLEGGPALGNERGHALLLVGGGKHGVEHAPLETDALGKRGLVGTIDAFLGHHGDRQRHGGNGVGRLDRILKQAGRR